MRRRWTREEDAELLTVELTPHTDRWSGASAFREIGRQLGRSRVACRSRYYKLQRERGHVPGRQWTTEGLTGLEPSRWRWWLWDGRLYVRPPFSWEAWPRGLHTYHK